MKNFRMLVMLIVVVGLFVMSGCYSPLPVKRQAIVPARPAEQPKPWESYSRVSDGIFKVSQFSIKRSGIHAFEISGVVSECSYNEERGEKLWKELIYWKEGYRHNASKWIRRNEVMTRKPWALSSVSIENPFGPDVTAAVGGDGVFSAKLTLDEGYFSSRPSRNSGFKPKSKYFRIVGYTRPKQIKIKSGSAPREKLFQRDLYFKSCDFDIEPFWFEADMDKVKSYVDSLRSTVNLEIMDRISRVPIVPDVVITGVGSPSGLGVEKFFAREFRDEKVTRDAMVYLNRGFSYVKEGEKKRSHSQSVSFWALKGFSYKIETTHGKYYYFSKVFKVENNVENKKILLIESGDKIRYEDVKEGEGGSMVDSD